MAPGRVAKKRKHSPATKRRKFNSRTPGQDPSAFCRDAKVLKLARNLILVLAGLLVVFTLAFNKAHCLFPSLIRDQPAGDSSHEITKFEMDSPIATGYSSLVCRIGESGPGKS